MALPREYAGQQCSIARALEIVGERWTLLIVRDAFFGVRRFSDFAHHLDIPRAVLSERLAFLVEEGVLAPSADPRPSYALTDKGLALWPVVRALVEWGDTYYSPRGPRRLFEHRDCGGRVAPDGRCTRCRVAVPLPDTVVVPGPGFSSPPAGAAPLDRIGVALSGPKPLLTPV